MATNNTDKESILMALDQLNQTIEVMSSVIRRLQSAVTQNEPQKTGGDNKASKQEAPSPADPKLLH